MGKQKQLLVSTKSPKTVKIEVSSESVKLKAVMTTIWNKG